MTTKTLKKAFKEAEKLPEAEQDKLARDVMAKVQALHERLSRAFTGFSEKSFEKDWDNEKDAAYDNWKERYGK